MNVNKTAARDAAEWLASEMAYGEGSGNRRKLVQMPIYQKMDTIPGYLEAFNAAYDRLDIDKFAAQAIKDHKAAARAAKVGQNFRALRSGNVNNLTTGVFIVAGTVIILHQTGLDKKIQAEAKDLYKKAKREARIWNLKRKGRNVERIV